MSTKIFFASNQLGGIHEHQIQMALDRFGLGKLVYFEETSRGVGKQNLFIRTSTGEYVLKGNPLYAAQFTEEQFYIDHLHRLTILPVPLPYLLDESNDIFGWSYSIMPRMPGAHLSGMEKGLCAEDRKRIAGLYAECLSQLRSWKVEHYGEFDPVTMGLQAFPGSYKTWLYDRIRYWLEDAKQYSVITSEDMEWVERLLSASEDAFDRLDSPSFVMGDFKVDNILVEQRDNEWKISGIFDFTTGYFGDGIADLPRMLAMYLENNEEDMARHFVSEYFNAIENNENFIQRFRIHMLHQRVLDWGCAKATKSVTWDHKLSFSKWAERFTESASMLLSDELKRS